MGLIDSVEFVSDITDAELAAYYQFADVLVMLSDHEGFGVPLVEAMREGLPIVAYDAGAVSEVLDGAGVLLAEKHPRHVADEVSRLMADQDEQRRLVAAGKSRFKGLGLENAAEALVEAVRAVSDRSPAGR